MIKYLIFRVNVDGAPKKLMHIHGHNIDIAWMGARCWLSDGIYLIKSYDGTQAKIFRIERI